MRQSLQSRLATLEARPQPEQPAQQTPMTGEELRQWCYRAFRFNELHIFDGVVKVNRWTAREHEYAALEIMANAINRWRADNDNEPFLPIMVDDATKALELLRAGRLIVINERYRLVKQNYQFSWEFSHEHARIGEALDSALRVYLASGGGDGQPYQPGEVEELLSAFVEHAEGNE